MAASTRVELDSVKLLSDEFKAVRAKVIAYLMIPRPDGEGYDFDEVLKQFKKGLRGICKKFWDESLEPIISYMFSF